MSPRRKLSSREKAVRQLLSDWYGEERASVEMAAYRPARQLSSELDKIMERMLPPETVRMIEIRNNWNEIAGAQLARIAVPIAIREGVLEVEVSHPAFLMELKRGLGEIIIKKINDVFGKTVCKSIRFEPAGKQYRQKGGF